jgi:peptide deformylase
MFNPKIIDVGEDDWYMEEGCLSWPGLYVKIKRPKSIQVRYQDADAQFHTETLAGITARVVLHEYDHLNGLCHIDRATRYHRDLGMKRWKKKQKL